MVHGVPSAGEPIHHRTSAVAGSEGVSENGLRRKRGDKAATWGVIAADPAKLRFDRSGSAAVKNDTASQRTTLRLVLRTLHDQIWAPIEKALPAGAKTIILSPGGRTEFHFAALLTPIDEFLIEK